METAKEYTCDVCRKNFARQKALVNHKNLAHPKKDIPVKSTDSSTQKKRIVKSKGLLKFQFKKPTASKNYNPAPYFGFKTLTDMFKKSMKLRVEKMEVPEKLWGIIEDIEAKYRASCGTDKNQHKKDPRKPNADQKMERTVSTRKRIVAETKSKNEREGQSGQEQEGVSVVQSNVVDSSAASTTTTGAISSGSDGKGYWCSVCNRGFSRLAALEKHKKASHDIRLPSSNSSPNSKKLLIHKPVSVRYRFQCSTCKRRFIKHSSYVEHQKEHDKIKCIHCGNVYKDIRMLKRHRAKVHKENPYSCSECVKTFPSQSILQAHVKLSHTMTKSKKVNEPVACGECGRIFDSKSKLNMHQKVHRRNRLRCEVCSVRYPTFDELMKHVCGENPYSCPECPQTFKNRKRLNRHLAHIHNGNRYGCRFCSKGFETVQELYRHEKNGHQSVSGIESPKEKLAKLQSIGSVVLGELTQESTKIYCEMCNVDFDQLHRRNKHMIKTHGPEWIHICQVCLKVFPDRGMLLRHQVVHKSIDELSRHEYIHDCDLCDLAFADESSLLSHQNEKHSDVKHLVCPECHECFIDQDLLEIHLNGHDDIETYCNQCDMVFITAQEIFEHKAQSHSGLKLKKEPVQSQGGDTRNPKVMELDNEYQCKICDHVFMDFKDYARHQKTHPEDDPFQCVYCKMSHPNKYSLKQHLPCDAITGKWSDFKYACDHCYRAFSSPRKLQEHQNGQCRVRNKKKDENVSPSNQETKRNFELPKDETSKKLFYCDSCGRKFGSLSALKLHKQTHLRDKRFACEFCGLGFADNNELARHRLDHNYDSEHKCFMCNKLFLETEELMKHELEHKAKEDLFCSVKILGPTAVSGKPGFLEVFELQPVVEDIIERKRRELP